MPVKLLDFKPGVPAVEKRKESQVKKLISEDVWMSCTPDMPALRYAKSIPVFVWDDMSFYRGIETHIGVSPGTTVDLHHTAYTKEGFTPFYQRKVECSSPFRNVLPSSPVWYNSLATKPNMTMTSKKAVKGKIINVNLFTLRLLDIKYNNTLSHVRKMSEFVLPDGSMSHAWLYTMPTDVFTKYDPHTKTYSLLNGFEPVDSQVFKVYGTAATTYTARYPGQNVYGGG